MGVFDDILSFGKNNFGTIANVGMGVWDYFNQGDITNQMQSASTSGQVDPFGQANRAAAQGRIAALQADPSSVTNTPGYQFSLDQGTKAVERNAAKSGQFHSANLGYALADYSQGLASQTYNDTMNREMQMAGANFQPNAAAFSNLTQSAGQSQDAQVHGVGQTIGKVLPQVVSGIANLGGGKQEGVQQKNPGMVGNYDADWT